ncbi:MAG TPA: Ig domain-containing protein, partial [Pirellulaceae bacterium]|nr:Ig domain-containing protein [Pirellulaceae bacterium]
MARNQKNKKSTRRTLSVEHLQSRQLMAADLAMAMAPEFDLDLSSMEVGQARVGQEIAFDMISSGATAGTAGGLVRFQLDPDSDQTPAGATLTEDGFFQWNPSEDQVGEFTFTVIAVNRDNFCEADAEKFTIVVRPMNEAPDLAGVPDQVSPRGADFAMDVSATDPNAGDSLTLNVINGPQGVSVEQTDSGQWVVHWTPDPGTPPGTYQFELQVSDGELTDTELFNVELTNAIPMIDLNGPEDEGTGSRQTFVEGKGSVPIAVDVAINDSDDAVLQSATARIVNPMNGAAESLGVDVSDTNITASYDSETGTLTLTGEDTVENYQRVLGSLSYNNESQDPHACPRQVEVTVNDG